MSSIWERSFPYYIGGGIVVTTLSIFAIKKAWQMRSARKLAAIKAAYPADTVILCQFPRGVYAPSLSPFPMKLETFLRMANITYQNQFDLGMSSKGKIPWITYNGEDVADSQFCIDFLSEKLDKNMDSHLSTEQQAIARAFQVMVDEHLYWALVLHRWVYAKDLKMVKINFQLPMIIINRIRKFIKAQVHAQGMGRHTQEEVISIARADLQSLSDYLGDKPYLMGDRPSTVDCAVFGMLAQIKWQLRDTVLEKMFHDDFKNLDRHCERMKVRFWPDWDQCNTAGGIREATK